MSDINVFALDEAKNNHLTMTKEQIYAAIFQAINEGTISDIDSGFVSKLLEKNQNTTVEFWFGTISQFEQIAEKKENTVYILTNDPTLDDIENNFKLLNESINEISLDLSGCVKKSTINQQLSNGHICLVYKKGLYSVDLRVENSLTINYNFLIDINKLDEDIIGPEYSIEDKRYFLLYENSTTGGQVTVREYDGTAKGKKLPLIADFVYSMSFRLLIEY